MNLPYLLAGIGVMMLVTYLPRMLPLTLFRKRIQNRFLQSFLAYVPFAVLAAMTFPAILYSSGGLLSAVVGLLTATALAWYGKGLLTVALGASGAVFAVELFLLLV